jgi:hypothetical protein
MQISLGYQAGSALLHLTLTVVVNIITVNLLDAVTGSVLVGDAGQYAPADCNASLSEDLTFLWRRNIQEFFSVKTIGLMVE